MEPPHNHPTQNQLFDSDSDVAYEAEIVDDNEDFSEKEDSEWYSRWLASYHSSDNYATTSSPRTQKSPLLSDPPEEKNSDDDDDDDDDDDRPLSHFAAKAKQVQSPSASFSSSVVYAAARTPPFEYKRPSSPAETAPNALPAALAAAAATAPNMRTPLVTNPSATFNTGYYQSTPAGSNHPFYQEQRLLQNQARAEARQPRRSNEPGEDEEEDEDEDENCCRLRCCRSCVCAFLACCFYNCCP